MPKTMISLSVQNLSLEAWMVVNPPLVAILCREVYLWGFYVLATTKIISELDVGRRTLLEG